MASRFQITDDKLKAANAEAKAKLKAARTAKTRAKNQLAKKEAERAEVVLRQVEEKVDILEKGRNAYETQPGTKNYLARIAKNVAMYEIYVEAGGETPPALKGLYQTPKMAQMAIETFLRKKAEPKVMKEKEIKPFERKYRGPQLKQRYEGKLPLPVENSNA